LESFSRKADNQRQAATDRRRDVATQAIFLLYSLHGLRTISGKINSLWQYSASTAEADGEGVPLSDTLSCMDFDDDGRAFFYFANKKGLRYSLDELAPENSALGTAIARIRQQQVSMLSWDSADDTMVYLDQNYEFASQVLSPGRSILYKADGSKLKNLCRSKSEIESVFSTLGARSGGRLPKIWRQLKDDMLASFASLAVEEDWLVISLEKQGLDLVRSIEKLARAGHCVKMEGKRVAVKKNRLNQLIKKLEAEGFKFEGADGN
jgi:hypothetical protein